MTDEERKELIEELRDSAPDWTVSGRKVHLACDELERLAEGLEEARAIATRLAKRWTKAIGIDAGFDRKIPE